MYTRALQNNVKNISLLNETEIKKLEPHVQVSINNNKNLKKKSLYIFFNMIKDGILITGMPNSCVECFYLLSVTRTIF